MTEHKLLELLSDLRAPSLDVFFSSVTWLGSLWLLGPLSCLFACNIRRAGANYLRAAFLPCVLTVTALTVAVLKPVIARPRPQFFDALLGVPGDAAMPSGHAAQVMAFAFAVVLISARQRHFYLGLALLPWVIAVGLSRLYLQVHWPTDILAGYFVGFIATVSAYSLCVADKPIGQK